MTTTPVIPKPSRQFSWLNLLVGTLSVMSLSWIILEGEFVIAAFFDSGDGSFTRIENLLQTNLLNIKNNTPDSSVVTTAIYLIDKTQQLSHHIENIPWIQSATYSTEQAISIKSVIGSLQPTTTDAQQFYKIEHGTQHEFLMLIKIICSVTLVWLVRCLELFYALPLFLITASVGLADGLMQRAIRRAELGRESAYLFHKLLGLSRRTLYVMILLFMVTPISLNPCYSITLMAVVIGILLIALVSRFKKYV